MCQDVYMTENTEITEITITEIAAPSRSKGKGWARIGTGDGAVFASTAGRRAQVGHDFTVYMGAEIRRATRTSRERETYDLVAAEGETVTLSVASPQSYVVRIDGARLA